MKRRPAATHACAAALALALAGGVSDAGDDSLSTMEGRQQKVVLRVGGVLEFIDKHEGICGDKRPTDVGIGTEQQLREPIDANECERRGLPRP